MIVSESEYINNVTVHDNSALGDIHPAWISLPKQVLIGAIVPPWQYGIVDKVLFLRHWNLEPWRQTIFRLELCGVNLMELISLKSFLIYDLRVEDELKVVVLGQTDDILGHFSIVRVVLVTSEYIVALHWQEQFNVRNVGLDGGNIVF